MKTSTLLSLAVVLALTPSLLHGAAGDLETPGVGYPGDYGEDSRKAVHSALTLEGCEFLGGHWINSLTTLRYAGDTLALGEFLEALSKCPGASLSVSFANELLEGGDWLVQHQAYDHHFHIRINLASDRISLPKLELPVFVAKTPTEEADAGAALRR